VLRKSSTGVSLVVDDSMLQSVLFVLPSHVLSMLSF